MIPGREMIPPQDMADWLGVVLGCVVGRGVSLGVRTSVSLVGDGATGRVGRYRVSSRTSVNARWRFGSNRPFAGYLDGPLGGPFVVTPSRNALRVPAYSRVDARVDHTYQRGRARVTLFAEVANLLNRENQRQVPPFIDFSSGEAF